MSYGKFANRPYAGSLIYQTSNVAGRAIKSTTEQVGMGGRRLENVVFCFKR